MGAEVVEAGVCYGAEAGKGKGDSFYQYIPQMSLANCFITLTKTSSLEWRIFLDLSKAFDAAILLNIRYTIGFSDSSVIWRPI